MAFTDDFESQLSFDSELSAPICSLDLEEWLELFSENSEENGEGSNKKVLLKNTLQNQLKSNLVDSIDMCNSLEDLVKTFDQNVKKCLSNYKDIDIGQLAPVQVRSQEQLMHESQ